VPFFEIPPPPADEEDDDGNDDEFVPSGREARFLGGALPLELLVARSEQAAVVVRDIVAFPDGFNLTVVAHVRREPRPRRGRRFHTGIAMNRMHMMDVADDGTLPDEFLRLGVQFPDGARVTNLQEPAWMTSPDATEPMHGMESGGGGGSNVRMETSFWVWPLPGAGELVVACEWPAYGIPETMTAIDAALVTDAAARAQPIWPDEIGPTHRTRAALMQSMRSAQIRTRGTLGAEPTTES
jgi:hypothetical protein